MGFWIFMLVCVLLIPIAMLAIGIRYSCHAPKKIQALHGYRSQWSMKNQATWEFAHHYCGRLWKWFGAASLPLSTLAMLPLLGRKADMVLGPHRGPAPPNGGVHCPHRAGAETKL